MKVCPKCGKEVPDQSKYCISCGEKVEDSSDIATDQPAISSPADEKNASKGKKTGLLVGIIVGVVAVIIAIAAIAMTVSKSAPAGTTEPETEEVVVVDPKEIVLQAFGSVFKDEKVNVLEDIFGFEELFNNASEESRETVIALQIDESNSYSMTDFVGGGLAMEVKSDPENSKAAVSLKATYHGMDFLRAELFSADEELTLTIPEVSEKLFVMSIGDDLLDQLNNSPYLGQLILDSAYGYNLDQYYTKEENAGQENEAIDSYDAVALWERYGNLAVVGNLETAMTVTEAGVEVRLVDGKEAECDLYEVVMPGSAFVDFFDKTCRFLLEDESFKNYVLETFKRQSSAAELVEAYGSSGADDFFDTFWSEMESGLDNLLVTMNESLQDDVRMLVYVDNKGRLAALEVETEPVFDGEKGKMTFKADLKGGDYLIQNAEVSFALSGGTNEVSSYGADEISFTMVKEGSYLDKKLQSSIEFTFDLFGDIISTGYSGSYQSDTGDFQMDLHGEMYDSTFGVIVEGVVNELQKGKRLDAAIDSIRLESDWTYYTLSGKFLIKPLESEIIIPEGTKMDILAATESEWQEVIMEGYFAMMDLMSVFE